jgi:uncharacterized membrane protein YbaN (DUF454 family)
MRQTIRKTMHLLIGCVLIVLGIIGVVLPIVNGTVLLVIGFIIISFENPYVEKKLFELTQKNQTIHGWYLRLDKILRKFFRK